MDKSINQIAHEAASQPVVKQGLGRMGENGILYLGEQTAKAMELYNQLAQAPVPIQRNAEPELATLQEELSGHSN
jgi:hypothetical protein